jgi:hypothetical protein
LTQFSPTVFGRLLMAVDNATGAVNLILPSQTGQAGKVLTTDGTSVSWETPTGSGFSGAFADLTGIPTTLGGYGITDAEGTITAGTTAQYWRGDKSWQTLNKGAVGLTNVDNTSDANKPISTAAQSALDAKADLVGGVVPTAQIPAIAITEFLGTVASQAAMLALTGQKGDWAIRSDTGATWVITGTDPTQLASWTSVSYPGAPVVSVNGQTGTVTLSYSDVGAQPIDATLTALAAVTTAANKLIYATGSDVFSTTDFSAFGRSLIDDADASAGRATLGLGSAATVNTGTTSGTIPLLGTGGHLANATMPLGAQLYDNAGTPKLSADFAARKLFANDGVTVVLDYSNGFAVTEIDATSDGGLLFSSDTGGNSVDWYHRTLIANDGTTVAIDWSDPGVLEFFGGVFSVDATTGAVIDHLTGAGGAAIFGYNGGFWTPSGLDGIASPDLSSTLDNSGFTGNGSNLSSLNATQLTTGTVPAARMPAHTGDVTSSSGSVALTIANSAVSLAKMANMATASLIYRKTAGAGAPEVNTLATLKTDLGLTGTNSGDQTITLTGDVTGSGTVSFAATIANSAVTLAKMANMATASLIYRKTAGSGAPEVNTLATLKTDLGLTGTNSGDQDLSSYAPLASPTFTGTPAGPTASAGTNTTQLATTAFVTGAISTAVSGLLNFKGTTDCSANPNYPSAVKGDAYIVSVAGKIGGGSGTAVDVGDWYIAEANNAGGTEASVGASWGHMEHNLVGALLSSNNLSDLGSASTARGNLGLGTLATQNGTFSGTSSGTNTGDQTITLTGDVTGSGTGSFAATIANDAVTYAKMQNVSATSRFLGRKTAGAGDPEELTASDAKTILAIAQADVSGLTTSSTPQFARIGIGVAASSVTKLLIAQDDSASVGVPYGIGVAPNMDASGAAIGGLKYDRALILSPHQTVAASGNSIVAYIVPFVATGVTQGTMTGLSVDPPQLQGTGAVTNYYAATFMGGNVGINASAPTHKLEVGGTGYFQNAVGFGIAAPSAVFANYQPIAISGSSGATIDLQAGSTTEGRFVADVNGMYVVANGYLKLATGSNSGTGTDRVTVSTAGLIRFHNYGAGTLISDGSGNLTSAGAAATSATTGAMTVTMAQSVQTITPTGACTFNASGGVAGQRCNFIVTTSGTSSFVLTFGTNFKTTGTLTTGTTTAKVFVLSFVCKDGTTWCEASRTVAM